MSRAICLAHTQIVLEKAQNLSFLVNWAKSELVLTQRFVFLGEAYDLVAGLVRPSEEAVAKVWTLCRVLRRQHLQTARFLLRLLGVLNSVADIIPYGRLHMRPLQLFLIAAWSMASQPLCFLVRLNEVFFHHLEWWENKHNLTCGVPLTSPETSSTLCTDSSTTGWGATLDSGDSVSGTWIPQEAKESINFLEMMTWIIPVSPTKGRSGSGPSQEDLGSPQPGFVPIPCLAVFREHLQTSGFSASTADQIALPQDASTMPSGRTFVVGAIDGKQILSQPMCP